jgi:hypothetical protein
MWLGVQVRVGNGPCARGISRIPYIPTNPEATRVSKDESSPNRRRFIARVAGGTAAIAAGLSATELIAQQGGSPQYPPPQGGWDMSWVDRVERLKHRQVFDVPELADGVVFNNVSVYLRGFAEVYKTTDADMGVVVVFRHQAVPGVLNDDMWKRIKLGERTKIKDPATGELALRNPYLRIKPESPAAAPNAASAAPGAPAAAAGADPGPAGPAMGVDTLIQRGFTVICCNLALMRNVAPLARAEGLSTEDARTAVINSLVPGVIRMPNGVFAVTRAQEAGCHFLRST